MNQYEKNIRFDVFSSMLSGLSPDEIYLLMCACSEELALLNKDHWDGRIYTKNIVRYNDRGLTTISISRVDKSSSAFKPFGAPDL